MGLPIDHKALFDAMPVPRLLVQVDGRKFTVIEANRRALEYFNRKLDQIVEQSVEAFMDSENARLFEQSFEVCVKQKMPVTIQALPNFPGGIRVHGFWINPLFDATGNAIILDVMAQPDSADDSILQRERDDAISLLTSIFDASEIGIIVTDRQQRIVRVNDSFVRTFGWSRDQLIGEPFMDFVPEETDPDIEDTDAVGFLERGTRASGEVKLLRSDGTISNALYTSANLELSQRRRFQVTTIMDISLRKQMEISLRVSKDQADAANHAKSAFLANMSHELRTPLNAIIGFSEIMMNETFGPLGTPKYKEYLSDVHLSARHLLEIINEVLDMSKIEAGKVELDEQIFDIGDLVQSVTRMMTSRAFSANIDLQTEVVDDLPLLRADARLIRQVLINLVSNAIKFSMKGGKISTKVDMHADGDLRITVADQGIGIPRDKIREALEPFGQIVDSNLAKEQQGTGLGLPLAKAMVELHGGMLDLQSETNVGTTVTVFLPSRRVVARNAVKGDGQKLSLHAASKIV
jgi:two-component system cell cycle sensor histidine kinase PleC